MTLADLVRTGKLPNIEEKRILAVCSKVGIDTKKDGMNTRINQEQYERLYYNAVINGARVKEHVNATHSEVQKDYDGLIKKYEAMIAEMEKPENKMKTYMQPEIANMKKIVRELKSTKAGIAKTVDGMSLRDEDLGLGETVLNPFARESLVNTGNKLAENSQKLNKEYQELERLSKTKYHSKFKQKKNAQKMSRIQSRITKLQNKQGKLQAKQKKLVNKGTQKYIHRRNKELDRKYELWQKNQQYAQTKMANKKAQKDFQADLKNTRRELQEMENEKGLGAAIERGRLKRDEKKLNKRLQKLQKQEERIKKLQGKKGSTILMNQYGRQIERAYNR